MMSGLDAALILSLVVVVTLGVTALTALGLNKPEVVSEVLQVIAKLIGK